MPPIMKQEIAAGGIVYNQTTKQWLICQHSQHKGWVFPKGIVGDNKADESFEAAALREVAEEGGVKAKTIQKLPGTFDYIYTFKGEKISKTVHYFLMEYISGDPKDHDWEMKEAKFVSAEEIRHMLTYPTEKQAFEEAVKLL